MRAPLTLGIGFAALIVLFTAITFPAYASILILTLILAVVLAGWVLRPAGNYLNLSLAAVSGEGILRYDGEAVGESYPQLLLFRVMLRRLYLIALPILAPLGMLMWILNRGPASAINTAWDSPVILYVVGYGFLPIVIISIGWLRERWLISHGLVVLGIISPVGNLTDRPQFRYEFIAPDGARYGGMYGGRWYSRKNSLSNFTPVLVDPANPERHLPVTALLFHQFKLVERRHLPVNLEPE
jgi:hypothetical protein